MKTRAKLLYGSVLIVAVAVGGWFVWGNQSGNDLATIGEGSATKLTDDQVQRLVARIGQFMVVPSDEKPSATILRDVAVQAQQQPFYKDAKNGDVLVVYSTRAIIYDPKADKLVNVGPIERVDETSPTASGSAQASPSPSGTPIPPEKVTIDVRNGTSTAGLAGTTASSLKKNTWVTIGVVGDAKGAYTVTTLVDLSKGKKPGAVVALEKALGVSAVTELPKGEAPSTADILVIVGK
jgi:hypothetical protein